MNFHSRRIYLLDAGAHGRPSKTNDAATKRASSRENLESRTHTFRVFKQHSWKLVIVEVSPDGARTYWEEEPGDVRRFGFTPNDRERQAIDEAILAGRGTGNSGSVIDLEIHGYAMSRADSLSLGAFRRFIQTHSSVTVAVELDRHIVRYLLELQSEKQAVNGRGGSK